jgi:hypothetical protein
MTIGAVMSAIRPARPEDVDRLCGRRRGPLLLLEPIDPHFDPEDHERDDEEVVYGAPRRSRPAADITCA